ncbi:MAG: EamA family transporter [Candidatus Sericytochromatia bacterium]|nr:EamA family transporter [Candidatus Sericytochromatia bacterium]
MGTWWFYALLSAFCAALTTILAKIGVTGVNSNLATAIRTLVIVGIAWAIVAAQGTWREAGAIPSRTWVFLILSGAATGLSWLFYFRALQLGKASQVAPIDKGSLVLTIALSAIFLGETLTWKIAVGSLCIVAGTLIIVL